MRIPVVLVLLLVLLVPATAQGVTAHGLREPRPDGVPAPLPTPLPAHGVIGVQPHHLDAAYWIDRHPAADAVRMDAAAIAAQNAALLREDPSVHELAGLPARHTRAQVLEWIGRVSVPPTRSLYGADGAPLQEPALKQIVDAVAADSVGDVATRYGMVTSRADMRSFPTRTRVFHSPGNTDIDRFQETAVFPGTPLAVLHESRDGAWWFAVSPRYAAWIEKSHVALGSREEVLGYGERAPYVVVTGATAETVYSPERPALSELQLDMGVRVPLLADWPPDRPVDGQHPYAAHVVELPLRQPDGTLAFAPALLPRSADVATGYLPLSAGTLLRQAFKFLGERYGWGHSYNGRDCSGFVSEVYRSVGIELPRNTRDQAVTGVLQRIAFTEADSFEERVAVLRGLDVGDLIYIPGHVMMVVGHDAAGPYVIHDTTGIGYAVEPPEGGGGEDGTAGVRRVELNQVAVTPLLPLRLGDGRSYVDGITSIQRVRNGAAP